MLAIENLSNAELRDELISRGLTDLGPINNSTRSVYIKKLEKLLKQNDDASSSKLAKDVTTKRRSMTPPRLTQSQKVASRRSVGLPVIFDDQSLNIDAKNGVNFGKIDKQSLIKDKSGPRSSRLPPATRLASKEDVVVKPKIVDRPPFSPNDDNSMAFSSSSSSIIKPKINDSKIVDDFRSILNDEQSWLKKLSSSSDATITRRLVAGRKKFDGDDNDYRFTTNNGKIGVVVAATSAKNRPSNICTKMKQLGAEIYSGSRKSLEYCRNLLGFQSYPDDKYNGQSVELQKFREMKNKSAETKFPDQIYSEKLNPSHRDYFLHFLRYPWIVKSHCSASGNRSLGIKTSATSRFRHWIKFDQETSRHIIIAFLAFLAVLSAAYFCTVYKAYVRSAVGHVYGNGGTASFFVNL